MKKENVIVEKSFQFALDIIAFYIEMVAQREYVLSKQLLKAGTSIGANVEEAQAAQSRNDFVHKLSISSKEARETRYWLLLLLKSDLVVNQEKNIEKLLADAESIVKILTKIIKTSSSSRF